VTRIVTRQAIMRPTRASEAMSAPVSTRPRTRLTAIGEKAKRYAHHVAPVLMGCAIIVRSGIVETMPGKRPGDTSRRLRLVIPDRAAVALVGRTLESCERLARLLRPRVDRKGGTLRLFSQLHQMEELAGERIDVLVLERSLTSTAREAVVWMVKRGNANVQVFEDLA
jgi:hypothetical protein